MEILIAPLIFTSVGLLLSVFLWLRERLKVRDLKRRNEGLQIAMVEVSRRSTDVFETLRERLKERRAAREKMPSGRDRLRDYIDEKRERRAAKEG